MMMMVMVTMMIYPNWRKAKCWLEEGDLGCGEEKNKNNKGFGIDITQ